MALQDSLPEPVFLSAPKAATLCGVSRNTVCCWIRDGKLPSYRTAGGKNLIRPGDLVTFMRNNTMFVPQSLVDMADRDEHAMGKTQTEKAAGAEPAILVVDDDPGARTLAVKCLEDIGLPIFQAETGYEAMHILTQHPEVALVILDLVMPGQHGAKTFEEIRKQNERLPVIVVTGHTPEVREGLFGEMGPDLIITKPYDTDDLVQAAQAFLADLGL